MTEALVAAGRRGLSAADSCAAGDPFPDPGAVLVERLIDLLLALEPFEIKQSIAPVGQAPGPAPGAGRGQGTGEAAGDLAAGAKTAVATPPISTQTGAETSAGPDAATGPDVSAALIEVPGVARDAEGASDTRPLQGDDAAKLSVESTRAMLARMRAVLDREAARLGEDGLEGKAAVDQVALIARTLEKIDQMERLIAEDQARAAGARLGPGEREQLRQTVRQLILAAAERLAAERAAGPENAGEAGL